METPRDPGNLQRPGQEDLGPQSPMAGGPQPPAPEAPAPGPGYGQVPPGGWDQPLQFAGPIPRESLAGWWPRLGAYLIDSLIVGIPAAVILGGLIGVGAAVGDDEGGLVAVALTFLFALLVVTVVALLYAPLLMRRPGQHNGQTWGKQALGIRVVRTNGLPFDFGSGAFREIVLKSIAVAIASSFFFGIPALLNFLWPLWDDDNRALHDMAAQTRVVRA